MEKKYQIIYVEDFAVIVNDDKINDTDYFYCFINGEIYHTNQHNPDQHKVKILASTIKLGDLPLFDLPNEDDEMNESAKHISETSQYLSSYKFDAFSVQHGFVKGYQLATKKYDENDLKMAFELSRKQSSDNVREYESYDDFKKHLILTKKPKYAMVEFENPSETFGSWIGYTIGLGTRVKINNNGKIIIKNWIYE